MPSRIRVALLLLVPLLLGACGTGRAAAGSGGAEPRARVEVRNQAFHDINVYVVASGQQSRLGTVTGNGTATFDIPTGVLGIGRDLSFRVDPIGSTAVSSSYEIFVAPGETVTLTVPPGGG